MYNRNALVLDRLFGKIFFFLQYRNKTIERDSSTISPDRTVYYNGTCS